MDVSSIHRINHDKKKKIVVSVIAAAIAERIEGFGAATRWTQGLIPPVNFKDGAIIRLSRSASTQRRTNRPTPSQLSPKVVSQEA